MIGLIRCRAAHHLATPQAQLIPARAGDAGQRLRMLPTLRDVPGGTSQVGLRLVPDHDVGIARRSIGLVTEDHRGGRGGGRRRRCCGRGFVAHPAGHRTALVDLHEVGPTEMDGKRAIPVISPAPVLLQAGVGVLAVTVKVGVVRGGGGGDGGWQTAITGLSVMACPLAAVRTVSVNSTDNRLITHPIIRMPAGIPGLRGTIGQIFFPVAGMPGALAAVVVVDTMSGLSENAEGHESKIRESESVTIRQLVTLVLTVLHTIMAGGNTVALDALVAWAISLPLHVGRRLHLFYSDGPQGGQSARVRSQGGGSHREEEQLHRFVVQDL
mmetsp:Transcript_784/g.1589  ORF Transcript_784/g.1589 Transcript_784/m.1589 type:complete len:326 (-) Transcript_784:118-1095(-)